MLILNLFTQQIIGFIYLLAMSNRTYMTKDIMHKILVCDICRYHPRVNHVNTLSIFGMDSLEFVESFIYCVCSIVFVLVNTLIRIGRRRKKN